MLAARNLVELGRFSTAKFAARPLFGERRGVGWHWISYGEWQHDVDDVRAGLAALGATHGDRIAIISRNSAAWATAAYATYGLGATFVPMYEAQRPDDWEFILRDCGAAFVFARTTAIADAVEAMRARLPLLRHVIVIDPDAADPRSLADLKALGASAPAGVVDVAPDEIAGLVYTSGTTGFPKGAMLTHSNIVSNVLGTLAAFPLTQEDRTVSFLPWAHVYGQACELHMLIAAGGSTAFNTDTTHLVDDLKSVEPTILVAVPRIFNQLHGKIRDQMEHKPAPIRRLFWRGHAASVRRRKGEHIGLVDSIVLWLAGFLFAAIRKKLGGRMKYAVSASATLSKQVAEFIDGLGIEVYEGYGLTETSPVVTLNRPGHRKIGSVGTPIEGVHLEIDESRGDAPGEGEIIVYGPNVMKGYHARPEENARAFTADGGLRTGDLGRFDEDGYLFITGRIKEQYKLENGKYVMPTPLEERLALSPYIKSAMLHGSGRPYNVALITVDADQLRTWAAEHHYTLAKDPNKDEHVHELIEQELARQSRDFRGYERPRAFTLTTTPFTVENGLLTPTLKLKRRDVLAKFGSQLDALYAQPPLDGGTPPLSRSVPIRA